MAEQIPWDVTDQAERSVLGSILRNPSCLDEVVLIIKPEHFRMDGHQKFMRVALDIVGQKPLDLVTMAEEMQLRGWLGDIGGPAGLADLWDAEPTGAKALYHAEIVKDGYLRRSLGFLAVEMTREATEPSCPARESLERFESHLWALSETGSSGEAVHLSEPINEALDILDSDEDGAGLETGFPDLNRLLSGFRDGDLVLIGARPSTGKTALALSFMRHLAIKRKTPCLFASLEQSRLELAQRLLAAESGINGHEIRLKRFNDRDAIHRISQAAGVLRDSPLFIDDCPGQTVSRIAANTRRLHRRESIRALFIDYIQLIDPEERRTPRHEQIGQITRRLKWVARELNIPVIALAQLNRASEDRKKPSLADFRESGSQEQDADVAILLHRDSSDPAIAGPVAPIQLIVAKHRNGPVGEITLGFRKATASFENFAYTPSPPFAS